MSATPAERKALLYLSGLLCLGVGVRVVGAVRREPPAAESRAALARQIEAVDSARREGRARPGKGRENRRREVLRVGRRQSPTPDSQQLRSALAPRSQIPVLPLDLDTASAPSLELLPGIGPALARRIVEDRERHGAFGSLEAFQRVRGIGPRTARALSERVTFSGARRPIRAAFPPPGGARGPGAP